MKILLIVAHGSRNPAANEEIQRLSERIHREAGSAFDQTTYAFLEIADPLVGAAIAELAQQGATEIKIFPYFLAAGSHVGKDIPRLTKEAESAHPAIRFEILPYLGSLDGIPSLILEGITASDK